MSPTECTEFGMEDCDGDCVSCELGDFVEPEDRDAYYQALDDYADWKEMHDMGFKIG